MTPVSTATRALQEILDARAELRLASQVLENKIAEARDAGVPDDTIAAELLRDGIEHDELPGLLTAARPCGVVFDERLPGGRYP